MFLTFESAEEKAAGTAAERERLAKEKEEEAQAQNAKAEEESRAQAAQAAAEKAEQERLAQEELIKAEEEAKARALAEAKEQAEKDRIAKEEASRELEAKNLQAKAEAEAEAEKKVDMEENQKKGAEMTDDGSGSQTTSPQNEAVQEREPLPKPNAANTFRWPWQKETEVEATEPLQTTTTESVLQPSATTKGDVQAKSDSLLPTPPRPLSPYTR